MEGLCLKRWIKFLPAILLSLFCSSAAFAQGSFYANIAWRYTPAGAFPAGNATVTVCTSSATGAPCTPKVSLFQDVALSIPVANPLARCTSFPQVGCIDDLGNFSFYIASGAYSYSISGAGLRPYGPIPIAFQGGGGGGGGNPNLAVAFSNVTSTTLNASSLNTTSLLFQCYDSGNPNANTIEANASLNLSTLVITFGFTVPQSGYCAVNGSGGGGGSGPTIGAVLLAPIISQTITQPGGTVFAVVGNESVSGSFNASGPSILSGNTTIPNIVGPTAVSGGFNGGVTTASSLNNIQYVSQFTGADLGAKINAAVAVCQATFTSCKYVLDVGGIISTPPSLPVGSRLECTATGPITLATTWPLNHRNTVYNFGGCQINYNQDSGNAAFFVGKNLSGVLTCNGTTNATWVSGNQFTTFDQGDQLSIASGNGFNVGAGSTATNLVLTTNCSLGASQTYASTSLGNVANIGAAYPGSVTIRDLNLSYTGAGTQNNIGLQYDFVTVPYLANVRVTNFTTGSGFYARGLLVGHFDGLVLDNDKNSFTLDVGVHSGISISSNANQFNSCEINNSPAGGKPFYITGASNGNHFSSCDFEGNLATVFGTIDAGSFKNRIEKCDQEANGDGTTSATDWAVNAADNEFIGCIFVGTGNFPNKGIIGNTSAVNTVLRDNIWLSFSSGYAGGAAAFSGSGYSVAQDNNIGSLSFTGFITNEDLGGNYQAVSMQPGAGIGVGSLPSAASNAGKMIYVNDSTAISAEGQTCVGSSTTKALAFSNGSVWKCF